MYKKRIGIIGLFLIALLPQPTVTAEEKSLAEWLTYVQEQVKSPQQGSPEFESIMLGAAYITGVYERVKFKTTFEGKHESLKPHILKYQEFIEGKGALMLEKWLKGETLSDDEKPYRFILEAARIEQLYKQGRKGYRAFCGETRDELHTLLDAAYITQKMSEKEMERLRLIAFRKKTAYEANRLYCPYRVFQDNTNKLPPGTVFENKKAVLLDSVLECSDYSDLPRSFSMKEAFTWECVLEYLIVLNSYDVSKDENGKISWKHIEKKDERFCYEKLLSDEKPTLLILEHPRDSFASKWGLPALEAFQFAYGDTVDIKILAVTYGDNCPPMHNFYVPPKDRLNRKQREYHAYSYENMARMAKEHYLNFPQMTVPFYLDTPGRGLQDYFRSAGGMSCAILFDKNHRFVLGVTTPTYQKTVRLYGLEKPELQGTEPVRMFNHVEQEIQAVLKNNGAIVPDRANPGFRLKGLENYPVPKEIVEEIKKRSSRSWCYAGVKIINIDTSTNILTVQHKNRKRDFEIVEGCRYSVKGKVTGIQDFNAGERVAIKYMLKNQFGDDETFVCTGMWKGQPTSPAGKNTDIWFCGNIKGIDTANQIITVFMPKPDPKKFRGYQYWKSAANKGNAWIEGDEAEQTLPIVTKWVEGGDDERTFRFKIDASVGLFLNGREKPFSDLKVGDCVGVAISYKFIDDLSKVLYPEYVRASRL